MNKANHLSVRDALNCVLQYVATLNREIVKLEHALGRVLDEEIRANHDQPSFDVSAMDGFALHSADLASTPAALTIIADIKAGDWPARTVLAGQCSRIMTCERRCRPAPMP